MVSKAQPAGICVKCGKSRAIHARQRCKNCYMQDFPPRREMGYCNDVYCPHVGQVVALVAKGKCQACYQRARRASQKITAPAV